MLIKEGISMQELACRYVECLNRLIWEGCWLCWLRLAWISLVTSCSWMLNSLVRLWTAALYCTNLTQRWHRPLVAGRGNSNISIVEWKPARKCQLSSLEKLTNSYVGYVCNWGTIKAVKGEVPALFLQLLLVYTWLLNLWHYWCVLDCLWSVVGKWAYPL